MFADQLTAAVDNCPPFANHFADLSRQTWRAWSSGSITDAEAQRLAERIAERKPKGGIPGQGGGENNAPAAFLKARASLPKRRNQQTPDKVASIARRRRLAASGGLPPRLAQHFTVSEQAALRIVLDAIRRNGVCGLCIAAIAAMAGTCRTVVKNALRTARLLGILTVGERRRAGQRSLTNLVRCIAHEVRKWLRMPDKGNARPTKTTGIRGDQKNDPYPRPETG